MPLFKKIFVSKADIAVWKIDEPVSFFIPSFADIPVIQNENKKLQWLATRYLANEILGAHAEIIKDASGKPWLRDSGHHISISHTSNFAAVMMNSTTAVGIDLETINPKVERIAHKFLTDEEIALIRADEKIRKLILLWSAKESLFKLYGIGNVEFKTQLLIRPFELELSGQLMGSIMTDNPLLDLKIDYEFFENHVLTYVVGR